MSETDAGPPATSPPVWVNILCTNEAHFLPRCLAAIQAQSHTNIIVTVIDNASTDGSAELAARYQPAVRLIRNPRNLYYCGGHNAGLAACEGGYIMPLNADVFLTPHFISTLVDCLEHHPEAGQAQGRLYQIAPDEPFPPRREYTIDTTGILVTRSRRNFDRGQEEPDIGQYDYEEEIFGADGSAPLYRWEMVRDIAEDGRLFDESFEIYREVVDLSWRARSRGWQARFVPSAVGFHVRGFSPRTRHKQPPLFRRFSYRNRYVTLLKNETLAGLRHGCAAWAGFEMAMTCYTVLREPHLLATWVEIIRRFPAIMGQRRRIRRRATTPPTDCVRFFI